MLEELDRIQIFHRHSNLNTPSHSNLFSIRPYFHSPYSHSWINSGDAMGRKDPALPEWQLFRWLFIISAVWNFAGAIPGLFDSAGMFAQEFGRGLTDPVLIAVYRGAWGTAFLYGFGFLMAAYNPIRHTGIVLMGGIGKALFALNLLYMLLNGWTSSFAILVVLGDALFVAAFVAYFLRLKKLGEAIL
ncbi:hypothetical protein [Chromobacterium sp. IIBBL 290-4]|uniref:hypothetical protein n=1 Tax=Chromobacterium sp. IIBBL 290-4 TaxID=2953890 RepID=UPI0020B67E9E|nr:hypothetical protein [Chromobacterium sp. IIBBL 290-4]UTH75156.1 hypothetical protein NKT35_03385 [Chromobacterium sp. IIBBL 290-4]